MTGVKFLFRVTLRRHDLAAEIYHLKEPQKLPLTDQLKVMTDANDLKLTKWHSIRARCAVSGLESPPTTP